MSIPFHDTKEVSLHGHGDASRSRNPATLQTPEIVEANSIEKILSIGKTIFQEQTKFYCPAGLYNETKVEDFTQYGMK